MAISNTDPTSTGRSYSLRSRLLWVSGLAFMVVALLQAALAYRAALAQADDAFDAQMKQLALAIRAGQFDGNRPARGAEELDFVVQAWSADGRIIYQSTTRRLARVKRQPGYSIARTGDKTYRVYATDQSGVSVQVSQDMDARARKARREAIKRTWPIALVGPLLVLLAGWIITRSMAPVERVRRDLARRKPGQLESIDESDLPDEVKPLVSELNHLFDRVSDTIDTQQHFIADAAHELRSPLTAIKLQLQNLRSATSRSTADDSSTADVTSALDRLEHGVERAARMIDQLISMARQEALNDTSPPVRVDLQALVRDAIVATAPQAADKQIDLGLHQEIPVAIEGWPDALQIMMQNLVSNAIKYTPRDGTVDVSIVEESGLPVIVVEDSGPGIDPDQRERVLDRFYRGKAADAPGSGLGLAIVKTICDRHHARLTLARSPRLGGLRASVHFPGRNNP